MRPNIAIFIFVLIFSGMALPSFAQVQELSSLDQTNNVDLVESSANKEPALPLLPEPEVALPAPTPQMLPAEKELLEQVNERVQKILMIPQEARMLPRSILFTDDQFDILQRLRRRLPIPNDTANTRQQDPEGALEDAMKKIFGGIEGDGAREVSLSGIVFKSSDDWIIWLNNTQITPSKIPSTIQSLKVFPSYIDLEWRDKKTEKIYPIRLRPNQRFNLDTLTFL